MLYLEVPFGRCALFGSSFLKVCFIWRFLSGGVLYLEVPFWRCALFGGILSLRFRSGSHSSNTCVLLQVTLWKESMEGAWVCVSEVDKGQEGGTQQAQIS